jgi:hypothetical protein
MLSSRLQYTHTIEISDTQVLSNIPCKDVSDCTACHWSKRLTLRRQKLNLLLGLQHPMFLSLVHLFAPQASWNFHIWNQRREKWDIRSILRTHGSKIILHTKCTQRICKCSSLQKKSNILANIERIKQSRTLKHLHNEFCLLLMNIWMRR